MYDIVTDNAMDSDAHRREAEQRVLILLYALGDEVIDRVLAGMDEGRAKQLRQELDALQQEPPASEELDDVLEEFERYLRLLGESGEGSLRLLGAEEEATEAESVGADEAPPFLPGDDPLHDLQRLAPYQLAGGLRDENPRTVALMLSQLPPRRIAEVMQLLPDETRTKGFALLSQEPKAAPALLQRIARTTVRKAALVTRDAVEPPDHDKVLADMLRAMEKKTRSEMLAVIEQNDADRAERVKELLYVFEDVLRCDDRSIQKLLTEIDMETLSAAMVDCDEEIEDCILRNLSKRARAALHEEMSIKGSLPRAQIELARKRIVERIAHLDHAGELIMDE